MKKIPMLEKFAAQSLVESDGELVFSKEKFAELLVRECATVCINELADPRDTVEQKCAAKIIKHFGELERLQ